MTPRHVGQQIWCYISSFPCHGGIKPDQNNLKEEKFLSAHSLGKVIHHTENRAAEAMEFSVVVFAHGSAEVSYLWGAGSREI